MRHHDDMNWYVWEATNQELSAWSAADINNRVPEWLKTEMTELSRRVRESGVFDTEKLMVACYLETFVDKLLEDWWKNPQAQQV